MQPISWHWELFFQNRSQEVVPPNIFVAPMFVKFKGSYFVKVDQNTYKTANKSNQMLPSPNWLELSPWSFTHSFEKGWNHYEVKYKKALNNRTSRLSSFYHTSNHKKCHPGCKESQFYCYLGKLYLACTSPKVISTSLKTKLMSRIDYCSSVIWILLQKNHLLIGQVRNRIH